MSKTLDEGVHILRREAVRGEAKIKAFFLSRHFSNRGRELPRVIVLKVGHDERYARLRAESRDHPNDIRQTQVIYLSGDLIYLVIRNASVFSFAHSVLSIVG